MKLISVSPFLFKHNVAMLTMQLYIIIDITIYLSLP